MSSKVLVNIDGIETTLTVDFKKFGLEAFDELSILAPIVPFLDRLQQQGQNETAAVSSKELGLTLLLKLTRTSGHLNIHVINTIRNNKLFLIKGIDIFTAEDILNS